MKKLHAATPYFVALIGLISVGLIFFFLYQWQNKHIENISQRGDDIEVLTKSLADKIDEMQNLRERIRHLESGLEASTSSFATQEAQLKFTTQVSDALEGQIQELQKLYTGDAPTAYVRAHAVFYVDAQKKVAMITSSQFLDMSQSSRNETIFEKEYREAYLSPKNKFIALSGVQKDKKFVEIYDISKQIFYPLIGAGDTQPEWLENGKIRISGNGGNGIVVGVFESKSADTPWELERVAGVLDATTTTPTQ